MFHTRNIPSFLFAIIICLYLDEAFPNHGAKVRIFWQKNGCTQLLERSRQSVSYDYRAITNPFRHQGCCLHLRQGCCLHLRQGCCLRLRLGCCLGLPHCLYRQR